MTRNVGVHAPPTRLHVYLEGREGSLPERPRGRDHFATGIAEPPESEETDGPGPSPVAVVVQAVTHMAQNVFPATRRTWICEALDEGPRGRAAVNLYLMQVYARPLEVYLRGSGYRTAGDPTDLVQGFLADRLARPGFLADWHHSGKPLRRWLANGLLLFVREELRRNQPAASGSEALATVPAPGDDPAERLEREFDQSFVISLVRRALAVTEQRCRSRNLVRHWQSFLLHHYYGMAFDEVAKKLGIPAQEAKETARAPRGRFRAALRELLIRDGIDAERVDEEIGMLTELGR